MDLGSAPLQIARPPASGSSEAPELQLGASARRAMESAALSVCSLVSPRDPGKFSRRQRAAQMESFREQRCRACLTVFWICRQCDRGQRYCRADCRFVGRARSVRDAKRKYLADPDVREGERERLREYRARVRDQSSEKVAQAASVPAVATSAPMDGADRRGGEHDVQSDGTVDVLPSIGGEIPCVQCGQRARFVRLGPLRTTRQSRCWIQARAP